MAVLGALWTAGAGIGTLALGWHRASDVAGAIVVVATWTFLMLAVDGVLQYRRAPSAEEREPRRGIEVATAWALGLAGAAGMVLGVVAFAALELPLLLRPRPPAGRLPHDGRGDQRRDRDVDGHGADAARSGTAQDSARRPCTVMLRRAGALPGHPWSR